MKKWFFHRLLFKFDFILLVSARNKANTDQTTFKYVSDLSVNNAESTQEMLEIKEIYFNAEH